MASMPRKLHKPVSLLRSAPICLAIVSLLALIRLRLACEYPLGVALESSLQGAVLLSILWARKRRQIEGLATILLILAAVIPGLVESVLRTQGQGTGLELIMLSSFGWTTLAATCLVQRRRALSTTVICSGFLMLLATCSSDQSIALVFAYAWGAICLWWLASSHWQRLANCQANTITESRLSRPLVVVCGSLIFLVSAWSVAGRFPDSRKLNYEVAPTSGGSSGNDPNAHGGVGDGDAVVAARENAASFGAVDTDVFLDSEEPSLFDLYSDTFGEPVRKKTVERAVALAPEQTELEQPDKMSQSDEASSKLTTQRRGSNPPHPLKPKVSEALLFWIGRQDMHLPLRRYSRFDGRDWSALQAADWKPGDAVQLNQFSHHNRVWFSTPIATEQMRRRHNNPFVGAEPEAIKYARLRTASIPAPAGMSSWHIDKIDDPTMFAVDNDDNLSMPGRERVPEFTIVRFVNRLLDIERIEALAASTPARGLTATKPTNAQATNAQATNAQATNAQASELEGDDSPSEDRDSAGRLLARQLLEQWLGSNPTSLTRWQQIQEIIERLRSEFHLDRQRDFSTSEDPLAQFLQARAGSDLMFATAAASMLKQLQIETRLVTGFVARREHRLGWSNEIAVYPGDMHAWLEVCLYPGCWLPLEPTPGYPQPSYYVTWRHWAKQHAWAIALWSLGFVSGGWVLWWQRARVFDALCLLLGWCQFVLNDRQRCRIVLRVLDARSRLIGRPRPAHVSPRSWYSRLLTPSDDQATSALQHLLGEADRLWFGQAEGLSVQGRRACWVVWYQTTCKRLQQAPRPSTS